MIHRPTNNKKKLRLRWIYFEVSLREQAHIRSSVLELDASSRSSEIRPILVQVQQSQVYRQDSPRFGPSSTKFSRAGCIVKTLRDLAHLRPSLVELDVSTTPSEVRPIFVKVQQSQVHCQDLPSFGPYPFKFSRARCLVNTLRNSAHIRSSSVELGALSCPYEIRPILVQDQQSMCHVKTSSEIRHSLSWHPVKALLRRRLIFGLYSFKYHGQVLRQDLILCFAYSSSLRRHHITQKENDGVTI